MGIAFAESIHGDGKKSSDPQASALRDVESFDFYMPAFSVLLHWLVMGLAYVGWLRTTMGQMDFPFLGGVSVAVVGGALFFV